MIGEPKDFEYWSSKVSVKYGKDCELVSVGELNEHKERGITIRCVNCGLTKTILTTQFRGAKFKRRGYCENCERLRKARIVEIDKAERARQNWINKPRTQVAFKFCECGQIITHQGRFCPDCRKSHIRENDRRKDVRRRARLSTGERDRDITLAKLYRRDNGVCYLCGGLCNWSDHITRDGAFIAGNTYPSVDHVKPLALGGCDTWDNVKLAHFRCNSIKKDLPLGSKI